MPEIILGTMAAVTLLVVVLIALWVVALLRNDKKAREGMQALQQTLATTQQALAEQQLKLAGMEAGFMRVDGLIRDEFGRSREELQKTLRENREEQANSLREVRETLTKEQATTREATDKQLTAIRETLTREQASSRETIDKQLAANRETLERQLKSLQDDNATRLEQMRKTVDEKLQESVEKRFNESFKLISERLDQVHKGLGEMQTLASGVGDLKKVLTNVKTRGNLGEIQLGAILEQVLSPEQYEHNAQVKPRSQERVEFAVVMPGKTDEDTVLLPIDSKFPVEDYERLLEAYDGKGEEGVETVAKRLELRIKSFARDIRDKYINPPKTTDFAIMFVPTEGLYAEVLRRPTLFETLQREYRVTVVGPTNLVAFLSSLQMGFKTLAIEKRSSEVWKILGAVKGEFTKFEGMLEGVQKKLDAASKDIDRIKSKSNNINRKMGKVQELPTNESIALLGEPDFEIEAVEKVGLEIEVETAPKSEAEGKAPVELTEKDGV
ncbi:MAG: DNA recombination protein RmuC [Coriobacteriales bacterium]|jgi:DNA recombination protein RmuC|nr:DNA recombination protein RmuC [Coriobacteriales bacterium]